PCRIGGPCKTRLPFFSEDGLRTNYIVAFALSCARHTRTRRNILHRSSRLFSASNCLIQFRDINPIPLPRKRIGRQPDGPWPAFSIEPGPVKGQPICPRFE